MKIDKWICIEQEVEINLTHEDINLILSEGHDIREVLRNLERIVTYLKGMPDSVISELAPEHRKIAAVLLKEQAGRFVDKEQAQPLT